MAEDKKINITDKPDVVVKNKDGSEYIPIGHIEQTLDALFAYWGTENHRFRVYILPDGRAFASGSVTLLMQSEKGGPIEKMEGGKTLQILPNDDNTDYEGTILSYCIVNAAKHKGIVFGRALNNRLTVGENSSLPVIDIKRREKIAGMNDENAIQFQKAKDAAMAANTKDEAIKAAKANGFSELNPEIKKIIALKPKK